VLNAAGTVGLIYIPQRPEAASTWRPDPDRDYPPPEAVRTFWARCPPVDQHTEAREQLLARGLDPVAIAVLDLARGLAAEPLPGWAWGRERTWAGSGHVVIIPLFDAGGNFRGVHGRNLVTADKADKARSPMRYTTNGLVLADRLGQRMRSRERDASEVVRSSGLELADGVPHFLRFGTTSSDADGEAPALLGIIGGGCWTESHARAVPDGTAVLIRTHADPAGEKYSNDIAATFEGRDVRVFVRLEKNVRPACP
jgi:hypothetical protein